MAVLRLPNETLLTILSLLPIPDIANTSLVSHQFNNLAQLPLYRHLILRRPHDNTTTSPLSLLLRTLRSTSPHKTQHTLSLRIHDDTSADYSAKDGASMLALLALLPRLDLLDIHPFFDLAVPYPEPFFTCLVVPRPTPLPAALRHIRELRIVTGGANDGLTTELLTLLMALPNLRTLSARVDDADDDTTLFAGTPGTSRITALELVADAISLAMLSGVLHIPRALASFVYRPPDDASVRAADLATALLPLRESLARLVLVFTRIEHARGPGEGAMGSLRAWHAGLPAGGAVRRTVPAA